MSMIQVFTHTHTYKKKFIDATTTKTITVDYGNNNNNRHHQSTYRASGFFFVRSNIFQSMWLLLTIINIKKVKWSRVQISAKKKEKKRTLSTCCLFLSFFLYIDLFFGTGQSNIFCVKNKLQSSTYFSQHIT